MTCACGLRATVVADVSEPGGIYVRTPICSPACRLVRQAVATVDVVLEADAVMPAIRTRTCWCSLPRAPGRYVTWCPTHGELDVVTGVMS